MDIDSARGEFASGRPRSETCAGRASRSPCGSSTTGTAPLAVAASVAGAAAAFRRALHCKDIVFLRAELARRRRGCVLPDGGCPLTPGSLVDSWLIPRLHV